MWRILKQFVADDYVTSWGHTCSLSEFVDEAFGACALNWQDHADASAQFRRLTDIKVGAANPSRAKEMLGWVAKNDMRDVVWMMLQASGAKLVNRQ